MSKWIVIGFALLAVGCKTEPSRAVEKKPVAQKTKKLSLGVCQFDIGEAIKKDDASAIKRLIDDGGCDPQEIILIGLTPLQAASESCAVKVVRLLVEKEVKLDPKSHGGFTPLHHASLSGCRPIVEMLLDKGVDVDSRGDHGATPLHLAVRARKGEVVKLLLDRGADRAAKTRGGLSALEIAKQFESKEMVELLKATRKSTGVLSREEIQKVVRKNLATLDPCYRKHHPDMSGWLNIEWVVDKTGKVSLTGVKRNTSKKKDLAECVMGKIRRWKFPKPRGGGNVTVMYPFHFDTVGD